MYYKQNSKPKYILIRGQYSFNQVLQKNKNFGLLLFIFASQILSPCLELIRVANFALKI